MKITDINKHYGKLKMKCFEMPNASYTTRYTTLEIVTIDKKYRLYKKSRIIKMKTIRIIIIFGICIFFKSCKEEIKEFEISANITGFSYNSMVIISDSESGKILDSTRLIDNKFNLIGHLDDSPTLLSLVITPEEGQGMVYTFIFIGNEKINIVGNKNDFPDGIKLEGSNYHNLKLEFDNLTRYLNKERATKLQKMFSLRQDGKWNDSLQSAYWSKDGMITKIDNETSKITEQFISDNVNSHFALSQLVTNKNDFSKEFIQNQLDKLEPSFQGTRYVNVLKTYLANKPLENGASFYNFKAEDQNGESVDFASFFNNDKEFTLLEFYSPHCSWCKKALPEIKELEKTENNKLQIVTYNVDKSKEDWLKTTKLNGITWTTLWNENGRYSDAYTKYRVGGTPTYYLFDKQGNVLKKWTGYDEELIANIRNSIE